MEFGGRGVFFPVFLPVILTSTPPLFFTFPPQPYYRYSRGSEVLFEALPAGVLQVVALLSAPRVSTTAVASVATACCSIAFTSASISFDWDTSPTKRKETPNFYGFVKDAPGSRTLTFLCLFMLAFFQVASKFFAIALLATINKAWVIFYLWGDMAVYMTYRAARGDLRVFLNLPNSLSTFVSIFMGPAAKILVSNNNFPPT